MKGSTHILLTLATTLLVLAPFVPRLTAIPAILACILFMLGAFFGSVTPDVDMGKGSAIFHAEIPGAKGKKFILTPIFGHTINILCYKPVRAVFHLIFGDKIYAKQGHRELPHSPIGIIFMSALLTLYIWLVCFGLSFIPGLEMIRNNIFIFIFGVAFLFGCFMHLIEDTCDIAGIHYLYPFSFRRIRGKLLGDGTDKRPRAYAAILVLGAIALAVVNVLIFPTLSLPLLENISLPENIFMHSGVFASAILWIIFLLASGVPAKKQNRTIN